MGAIGPHDSTPEEHRVGGSGAAPLTPGSDLRWSGPCGTTDQWNSAPSNFDHFFVDARTPSDLEIRITTEDPSDVFDLYLYRGRVDTSEVNYPDCSPEGVGPGSVCQVALDAPLVPTGPSRSLSLSDVGPGVYSVRVVYAQVVAGSYVGSITVPSDPTEESLPPPESPRRGSYGPNQQDRYFAYQWGLENIMAPQAWEQTGATGFGITIAVIDTGVDLEHPEFGCPGKLTVLEGAALGKTGSPDDQDGHGTHVAGIAAACGDHRGVIGVAPDAAIMPIEAVDAIQSSGDLPGETDQAFADAINFAVRNGAHVINISLGLNPPEGYLSDLHTETEKALKDARDAGVVVVAAAGNFDPGGAAAPSPVCGYPALSKYVLCVGATDRDNRVTYYSYLPNSSSDGDAPDVRAGIVAPGGANRACSDTVRDGIVSAVRWGAEPNCGYERGYAERDGTSMASPHVAGVAALVYDRLGGARSADNGAKVLEALLDTATDLYMQGPDPVSGHGLVNALAAVQKWPPSADPDPDPEPSQDPTPDPGPSDDPAPQPEPSPEPSPSPSDPGSPTAHHVMVSPRDVKGAVGTESTLTVTIVDAGGEPLSGIPVEWASVGVGELVAVEESTDAAGRALATVVSDEPGDQGVVVWTDSCDPEGRCWDTATRHHGPEVCDVFGTRGDDLLKGGAASEVICAFGGADVVVAGAGDDTLIGGPGNDDLRGGAGNDRLNGGRGGDLLIGGRGRDVMSGGAGKDTCWSSSGDRSKSCRA